MMAWYYHHCWPLWLLLDAIRAIFRKRVRKRKDAILRENIEYLKDCKARGVSPYDHLEKYLEHQMESGGKRKGRG